MKELKNPPAANGKPAILFTCCNLTRNIDLSTILLRKTIKSQPWFNTRAPIFTKIYSVLPWPIFNLPKTFHGYPIITFCVRLRTDGRKDKHNQKHNLLGGGNKSLKRSFELAKRSLERRATSKRQYGG